MMTKAQATKLAEFVAEMRTDWDVPGIVANIAKVQHLNAWESAHALLRLAENPKAKTPGSLALVTGEHWRERSRTQGSVHPKREEACHTCGRHLNACTCGEQATRPPTPAGDHAAAAAAIRKSLRGGTT